MRREFPRARLPRDLEPDAGLTAREAVAQRERFGSNRIAEVAGSPWRDLARETARDPMIWFLAGVGVLYALVGQRAEALTLLAAVAPLVGMDAYLHRRTQASIEGLRGHLAARATVVRDGARVEIPAIEVVPGDLAIVASGASFPADGVVVQGDGLQAEESALTGEAYPVAKRACPTAPHALLAGEHWAFAGTRLLTGTALVRVVYTGAETVYGEIVRSAEEGGGARTPLQAAIARLVRGLVLAALALCLVLATARVLQGHGWLDALVSAVTLASAALPEEFPVAFGFFLGVGVYRLAQRRALVRRAVSVENIGRVTCICSDKTGTITEGRLDLTHCVPAPGVAEARVIAFAAVASRAETGDPLDVAIAEAARGAPGGAWSVQQTFPFTEGRKRETAITRAPDGALLAVTKGAAETVLAMTSLPAAAREAWEQRVLALAAEGHKVIACAGQPLDARAALDEEPLTGYTLAGVLAFEDPVRKGVAHAVTRCREEGVRTLMVTGDHPATARAVAREIGLGDGRPVVVSGDEVEAMLGRGDAASLGAVDVVARAAPAQKLALMRGLQAAGEVVAVTGDGVNDVPALQAADVGIAMGERGTRSAREIASIVLLDDDFSTIVNAVAEGRRLFGNLRLAFIYLLVVHIPLVVTATLVPLAGFPLLYLPVHIVWLEMIIHPTALLVFQDTPGRLSRDRARPGRSVRFFSPREWTGIVGSGALLSGLGLAGYLRSAAAAGAPDHSRAMALVTFSLASAVLAATLSRLATPTARVITALTLVSTFVLVQTPALAARLHVQPLRGADWATALAGSLLAVLPLVLAMRRRERPGR